MPEENSAPASVSEATKGGVLSFANISVGTATTRQQNEIDEYLHLPVENVLDPLKWWYDHRRVYPNLSQMAIDYLSIPREWFLNSVLHCTNMPCSNVNIC